MKKILLSLTLLLGFIAPAYGHFYAYQEWHNPYTGQTLEEYYDVHLSTNKAIDPVAQQDDLIARAEQYHNPLVLVEDSGSFNSPSLLNLKKINFDKLLADYPPQNPLIWLYAKCVDKNIAAYNIECRPNGTGGPLPEQYLHELHNYRDNQILSKFYASLPTYAGLYTDLEQESAGSNFNYQAFVVDARILHTIANNHHQHILLAAGGWHIMSINNILLQLGWQPGILVLAEGFDQATAQACRQTLDQQTATDNHPERCYAFDAFFVAHQAHIHAHALDLKDVPLAATTSTFTMLLHNIWILIIAAALLIFALTRSLRKNVIRATILVMAMAGMSSAYGNFVAQYTMHNPPTNQIVEFYCDFHTYNDNERAHEQQQAFIARAAANPHVMTITEDMESVISCLKVDNKSPANKKQAQKTIKRFKLHTPLSSLSAHCVTHNIPTFNAECRVPGGHGIVDSHDEQVIQQYDDSPICNRFYRYIDTIEPATNDHAIDIRSCFVVDARTLHTIYTNPHRHCMVAVGVAHAKNCVQHMLLDGWQLLDTTLPTTVSDYERVQLEQLLEPRQNDTVYDMTAAFIDACDDIEDLLCTHTIDVDTNMLFSAYTPTALQPIFTHATLLGSLLRNLL